jgi:hypothetical protein
MNPKRDPNSKAIINTDAEALNKYKLERAYYRKIDSMQKDLIEIKRSIITIFERIEKLESN